MALACLLLVVGTVLHGPHPAAAAPFAPGFAAAADDLGHCANGHAHAADTCGARGDCPWCVPLAYAAPSFRPAPPHPVAIPIPIGRDRTIHPPLRPPRTSWPA